ncbi:MAG TPA: hypothetical protein VK348_02905 [Planctomycetota bacterium]|nr:hypothetical protein [Planctomycetota bacterium]
MPLPTADHDAPFGLSLSHKMTTAVQPRNGAASRVSAWLWIAGSRSAPGQDDDTVGESQVLELWFGDARLTLDPSSAMC